MPQKILSTHILFWLFFISCSNTNIEKFDKQFICDNKFNNAKQREIYQLLLEKKTGELVDYLKHSNPYYRETAALVLASLQDSSSLGMLIKVLEKDESIRVRMASAFAIGQLQDTVAEAILMKISETENLSLVKDKIYEAIGKCGTKRGHDWLSDNIKLQSVGNHLDGILLGLSRYSIRGIASEAAIEKIVEIIGDKQQAEETRFIASIYLTRIKGFDLSKYANKLIDAFKRSGYLDTKMNLVTALSKAANNESYHFLDSLLAIPIDYRIKVNAIRSISVFPYSDINKLMIKLLNAPDVNVAIQASEYFLGKGIKQDAGIYFSEAKKISNWRVRTNMFIAALRLSARKGEMAKYLIGEYKKTSSLYEKGNLLRALGGDFDSFEFIRDEIKAAKDFQISTAGIEALADMRRTMGIQLFRDRKMHSRKVDFFTEFSDVFKDAIISGDAARVGIAAEIIRDTSLDFRQQYKNSYFLTQALNACKLPAEIESYRELQKTIAFINGTDYQEEIAKPSYLADWDFIAQIPFKQKVFIHSSKGKIEVELNVNDAPVSVSNFLKLISEGYFNNKLIHRVVPNFVVQDGCPRGDGWGGPDYTICSEFAMNYYTEGSLGMASAGKDTESSQWFITHSPTPHLDGRYTNFGKVVKGMDIVHNLEVGDTILRIELISSEK